MAGSVATPQNVRHPVKPQQLVAQQRSQEMWDDIACTVYKSTTAISSGTALVVPMPYPGVIEVMASALLNGAGTLTLHVDGGTGSTATTTSATTAIVVDSITAGAGTHTFWLTSGASISQVRIICRRGRPPNP